MIIYTSFKIFNKKMKLLYVKKYTYLSIILLFNNYLFCQSTSERVPEWTKTAIWYQIFPERFFNGDTGNDPTTNDMLGGWPYSFIETWQISKWTSDWYQLQTWEKESGYDFYYNVQTRRYGGDLSGIIKKLDYLDSLGVNAIYLNPIFESPSLHKYDATMYNHIDNNFGPNPKMDKNIWENENPLDEATWEFTSADSLFIELIDQLHKRDMKIIIDGVFNHMGATNFALKDIRENGEKSIYKDWFYIIQYDTPETEKDELDYKGWFGAKDLPELREDSLGLITPIKNYIFSIVERWMDPNNDGNPSDGIDGWRLDVADMVNIHFWKDFRKKVKSINPEAYLIGEVWWEDHENNIMHSASPWLQGDVFDAIMNYRAGRSIKKWVFDKKYKIDAKAFYDSLMNMQSEIHPENLKSLMNIFGTHDTERLGTMVKNPDIPIDHLWTPENNPDVNIEKPNKTEYQKLKLAIGILFTIPGAPHIFYGDEAGIWGADDPDCRKPMIWSEFKYDNEITHPKAKIRNADSVFFNKPIFNWYKKLIKIRKENIELSLGNLELIYSEKNVLAFKRSYKNFSSLIIINNNDNEIIYDLTLFGIKNNISDLITKGSFSNSILLKPYSIGIFK